MKKEFEKLLEKLKAYLFVKLYDQWVAPNPEFNFEEYANTLCRFYSDFEDFLYSIDDDAVENAVEKDPFADEEIPF